MSQILIALDQLLNTLAFGYADETLSARAYRETPISKFWSFARKVIDFLFFWQPSHCYQAWLSEFYRHQYPSVYSALTPAEAELYPRND